MQSKNSEKKPDTAELEKVISPILVANSSKLKPFIELFESYPENVLLQPLGAISGFFKINDLSDDSAYIVNFISSVIKKEYFINHKRSVSESFDSALHKVNLALAEIVKNGNTRWLGQLDAAICVLEKNIFHFTICGTAQVFLLRNQTLSEISKDLNPEELEPNPIKTFSNVSSGYLEKGDKIIVTSSDLFNIFSLNEIKKGALRFDQEKFVQFFKTAMVNELTSAATIVIDINENIAKAEKRRLKNKETERPFNPFSEKSFEKPVISQEEIKEQLRMTSEEDYTDGKTGHIYIQGDSEKPTNKNFWETTSSYLREKFFDFYQWLRNRLRKLRIQLVKMVIWIKHWVITLRNNLREKRAQQKEGLQKIAASSPSGTSVFGTEESNTRSVPPIKKELAIFSLLSKIKTTLLKLRSSLASLWSKIFHSEKSAIQEKSNWQQLLPNFSKIRRSFNDLNYQQKLYAFIILILIIVVPFFVLKLGNKKKDIVINEPVSTVSEKDLLLQDKNIEEVATSSIPSLGQLSQKVVILSDAPFSINSQSITTIKSDGTSDKIDLPQKSFDYVFPMEDLNLIFFLSRDGKIFSFSPVSRQFKDNALALPENTQIEGAGTYLTYLYIADAKNNQLYRFPRSEGGFGEKIDWLKEDISLTGISDLAIEENIFLAQNNTIIKLFRGKKQDFNPEKTSVPLVISNLFTGRKLSNLYVLDAQNGRVAKFSKDGLLLGQYYNENLKQSTSFSVDEKNNKVFFTNSQGVFSFEM